MIITNTGVNLKQSGLPDALICFSLSLPSLVNYTDFAGTIPEQVVSRAKLADQPEKQLRLFNPDSSNNAYFVFKKNIGNYTA